MTLVNALRLFTLLGGVISFGLSAATLLIYATLRRRGVAGPLATHVMLLAIGHLGLVVASCAWIINRYVSGAPVDFFATPLIGLSFLASNAGLTRLLYFEGSRVKTSAMMPRNELMVLKAEADRIREDHERRLKALEGHATTQD